jgi:hypothetical protein
MNIGIFGLGVFVTALLIFAILFSMNEFKKMGESPNDYRDAEAYKNKDKD